MDVDEVIPETLAEAQARLQRAYADMRNVQEDLKRLQDLLNTPLYKEFTAAVEREAAHQVARWGTPHDRGKAPEDWYWLLAYLSGKALRAHIDYLAKVQANRDHAVSLRITSEEGDTVFDTDANVGALRDKALHHTISSAAVLLNWHAHILGQDTGFTPGKSDLEQRVDDTFPGEVPP